MEAVDDLIGNVCRRRSQASGLAGNTYIVFSSDNGYHMGEHRLLPGKMTAFDTDIRVPLVVVGPGVARRQDGDADRREHRPAPDVRCASAAAAVPRVASTAHSLAAGAPTAAAPRGWRDAALVEHHGPDHAIRPTPTRRRPGSGNPTTYEALRTREHATSSTRTASASTTTCGRIRSS